MTEVRVSFSTEDHGYANSLYSLFMLLHMLDSDI